MSKIEVNQISSQCGSTLTIGQSGDTVTLAAGATQSGFGRTGTVDWNTTAITADPNPAVSGTGYFVNTTSGAITVTLPTSPAAGDIVAFADYALTWDTNNLILDPGSNKINGDTEDYTVSSEGKSLTLVYTDSTQGWKVVNDGNSNAGAQTLFVTATGGTISYCGDYKIHTFTSPGTFCVSCAGNASGSNSVDYLVVAGGGGGGSEGGGAGAGGYRESSGAASGCYSVSPLGACVSALPVSVTGYPVTVGGGGAGDGPAPCGPISTGTPGSNSVFSTIISAGGGGGGSKCTAGGNPQKAGASGGSGGGGSRDAGPSYPGGAGNTPPVAPPQGNNGGNSTGTGDSNGAGGGGATAVGGSSSPPNQAGGSGGSGATSSINGTPTTRAGGGGGGTNCGTAPSAGAGGPGGGGAGGPGGPGTSAVAGTANTGGGGGGGAYGNGCAPYGKQPGKSGGSGIVIIRYKYQ